MLGVGQRMGLGGVLLGLADHPAAVAGLGEGLECGYEVDAAVAGDRVDAVEHGIEEAPALGAGALHHIGADVLDVDVVDALRPLLRHRRRIVAGEGEVAGVEQQARRCRACPPSAGPPRRRCSITVPM